MPRRTSVADATRIEKATDLSDIVQDKRNHKRADAKRNRRNRHYVKLLLKHLPKPSDDSGD
jgi:hypothetical protein